jgi:hypothetical protein
MLRKGIGDPNPTGLSSTGTPPFRLLLGALQIVGSSVARFAGSAW